MENDAIIMEFKVHDAEGEKSLCDTVAFEGSDRQMAAYRKRLKYQKEKVTAVVRGNSYDKGYDKGRNLSADY